jgi:hypothetical protein
MVDQIMRMVDGNGGSLLFAASGTTPFDAWWWARPTTSPSRRSAREKFRQPPRRR